MIKRRQWQRAVAPVEFPPKLRARLDRVGGTNMADRFRRESIFDSYRPKLAIALAEDHLAQAGETRRLYHVPCELAATGTRVADSWIEALRYTTGQHGTLQRAHLNRAFDEQEIRDYADNYARLCSRAGTVERRVSFTRAQGVDPPQGRNLTIEGACARMDNPQWWRRKLRAAWTRRAENVMREIGIVRKRREPYASDDAVMAKQTQAARGRRFLETHEAANELGEQLNLLELAKHSNANPAIRRAEFMTRVAGFEEVAKGAEHVAQFWTLTTPSAFHAWNADGEKNENFRRFLVREGQAWLCKQWARARAKLKRLSILMYGFRIAEPHHDGTPHWHLLIFCRPADAATIEMVIRGYWLKEYPDEKGAQQYRAKCIAIDDTKGSATGYIAKYVSKNIDAAGEIGDAEDDETGAAVSDGVRRVHAWASLHGIRQFQQLGGPPVGLWRELRRLREPVAAERVEAVRLPASQDGSWAGFIAALGGIERGALRVGCVAERFSRTLTRIPTVRVRRLALKQWRKKAGPRVVWESRPATPAEMPAVWLDKSAPRAVDRRGREVLCSTQYGETPGDRAAGIVSFGLLGRFQSAATRPHRWRIQKCLTRHSANGSGVMNPPRSAAWGREAGNPIALNAATHIRAGGIPAAGTYPGEGSGGAGPAFPGSFWNSSGERFFRAHGRYPSLAEVLAVAEKIRSGSGSESGLGPVAITVRDSRGSPANGDTSPPAMLQDELPRDGPEKPDG